MNEQDQKYHVLCVGPLSVLPLEQGSGIGTALLTHPINLAKQLEYRGMILFGTPGYYYRFGFVNAQKYGITTKEYQNFESFMALECQENGLSKVNGRFFENKAFDVGEEGGEALDG